MTEIAWRREMYESAKAAVEAFTRSHPDFSLDTTRLKEAERQLRGGTNFILFGFYHDLPVVFKYYHEEWGKPRFRNEYACLRHFAATGCVPEVYAVAPEQLIVMTCLKGRFINQEVEAGVLDADACSLMGREIGQAVGRMVNTPLPPDGAGYSIIRDYALLSWNTDLCAAVRFYTDLCRRDLALTAACEDPFYEASIALVESQVDRIPHQRKVIFHEDFHCFVHQGRFQGFFDLEMCRQGTELMQVERVFQQCAPDGMLWADVLAGYSEETGRVMHEADYVSMLAMALFYHQIRITRWGKPDQEDDYAMRYLPRMKDEARKYAEYVELAGLTDG